MVQEAAQNYIVTEQAGFSYEPANFRSDKAKPFTLEPLSIGFRRGEIAFVVGANGSGKSTLCRLLAGIIKPECGDVYIDGRNTKELALGEIGSLLGYLWQKPELQLFSTVVKDEIVFVETLKGASEAEAAAKSEYWLQYFQIDHLRDADIFTLSGGEKQRLALAAVMSMGAGFLILDEPSKALDDDNKDILIQLLRRLRADGIGMIIISHDSGFVDALADRVITIAKGAVTAVECRTQSE